MRFSERQGIAPVPTSVQTDEMSDALRNSLWNIIYGLYEVREKTYWYRVSETIAQDFRKVPVDELPGRLEQRARWVREYFFSLPWHGVYDLCEFVAHNHRRMTAVSTGYRSLDIQHRLSGKDVVDAFNTVFEQELSGYRFVNWELVPITSPLEIKAIETAVDAARTRGLKGADMHLTAALEALGKKPTPDYRGCVQEAIHAVESVAVQIDGGASKTLDPALKALTAKTTIHPALQAAFGKMYGYTNDADGIRHAIIETPTVDYADAQYMLVSCSAFVHYLIQKANTAGLLSKK